jgi:hypothetical protein
VGTDSSYMSRLESSLVVPRLFARAKLAHYFGADVATLLNNASAGRARNVDS